MDAMPDPAARVAVIEQRTRLGAGLLGCPEAEVADRAAAMEPAVRRNFSENISWLVDYEAAEAEMRCGL